VATTRSRLWFITGKHWKSARDHNGDKIPEGDQRPDPWTTVRQVAAAVAVLERLHQHQLLLTAQLHPVRTTGARSDTRPGQGRTARDCTETRSR